jgi:RNA polymerase sigma factor (sigma-70 family)
MPSLKTNSKTRRTQRDDVFAYDETDDDLAFLQDEVGSFQELQRSTGSEILNNELQAQIDQAADSPNIFLDAHISDASYFEKIAMSSIPEQLPKPAVNALSRKKTQSDLNFSKTKVTPEQEIELGKIIQKGVRLHTLRSEFEEKEGRTITRQEWTKLAGLESATELRRLVSDYRRAKQLLVTANMGLVHAIVKKQINLYRGLPFEEVVQEGSLGLLRAAELFDPSRGLRFSTYATIWIKGTLSNSHLKETIVLPQREKTKWNKIVKAHAELTKKSGVSDEPSVEQVAVLLGIQASEVIAMKRKMNQAQQVLSLDYETKRYTRSGGANGSFNRMEDDKAFRADADLAERTQMHADVVAAMTRNLDAREARLVRLRYGLSDGQTRSISQCAEAMGLSQTRVQQLAKTCLKKLRAAAEAASLEEYLLTIA